MKKATKKRKGTNLADEIRPRKKRNKLDPRADFDQPVKKPRQKRLPGMEDNAILDLEEAAIEHSETLTQIAALRAEMKGIDTKIATIMRREGKKTYNRGGIKLKLREGTESVSVQVKRHDREESAQD
jgi:hypothetical protein